MRTGTVGRRPFAAPVLFPQPLAACRDEQAGPHGLSSADGELNNPIAERLKLTEATVGKWRMRFIDRYLAGLYDDVRPGKPRKIDDERVASLITTTLHAKPANGSTHWSVRTVAAETCISEASVTRYFQFFRWQ